MRKKSKNAKISFLRGEVEVGLEKEEADRGTKRLKRHELG
jgi:hypothetical protein